jgi:hypothetical protein
VLDAIGALRSALIHHIRSMDQNFAAWCLQSAIKDVKSL